MNNIKLFAVLLCTLSAVACSTTGRIEELLVSPDEVEVINHHGTSVKVDAIGGDRRFVGSAKFKAALIESLKRANVFSSAADTGDSQYELSVIILRSENSGLGGSYLIRSKWILTEGGKEIWAAIVPGNGSSAAFGGAARIRASAERASKDTIRNGIKLLGDLSL